MTSTHPAELTDVRRDDEPWRGEGVSWRHRSRDALLLTVAGFYGVYGWLNIILTLGMAAGGLLPAAAVLGRPIADAWWAIYPLIGAAMILAAIALAKRRRGAWAVAVGLMVVNLLTHLVFSTALPLLNALSVISDLIFVALLIEVGRGQPAVRPAQRLGPV